MNLRFTLSGLRSPALAGVDRSGRGFNPRPAQGPAQDPAQTDRLRPALEIASEKKFDIFCIATYNYARYEIFRVAFAESGTPSGLGFGFAFGSLVR